jgi:hypothetical protein
VGVSVTSSWELEGVYRGREMTTEALLSSLERDLGGLIAAYVSWVTVADDASAAAAAPPPFAPLRALWIERQLSLLHHATPPGVSADVFTQHLFSIALGASHPLAGAWGLLRAGRPLVPSTLWRRRVDTVRTALEAELSSCWETHPGTVLAALLLPENRPVELAGSPTAVCHGALFMVYLLYFTQVATPKVKVYLPLGATHAKP